MRPEPRRGGMWLVAVPAAAGISVVLWLIFGGGGGSDLDTAGPNSAAVLGAACDPSEDCPTPTPRPTPAVVRLPTSAPAATPDATPPPITAPAVVVIEEPCGAVLYELKPGLQLPPASVTKIMTALVTVDYADLDNKVTVTTDGPALSLETDSTVMGIEPGMRLSVRDLLYGLLLASGNDAAVELAGYVAGSVEDFVDLMNDKARALGLANTHFTNPHGLDSPAHYSSAMDIATMGRALLRNPDLARIVRTQSYRPDWDGGEIRNVNLLITGFAGAIGVKTGYTDIAHQTIVGAAEDGGRRVVVAMLRADDMYAEAPAMLNWAFAHTQPACTSPAAARG